MKDNGNNAEEEEAEAADELNDEKQDNEEEMAVGKARAGTVARKEVSAMS